MGFEYLDHPLGYKHVKDRATIVLKGKQGWLKKKIERGDP